MRTFTTEHTVYNFNELTEEAKEQAREWYREGDNLDWLPDDMDYKLNELLAANRIKPVKVRVYYSLGYCQGDGAMFAGDVSYKGYTFTIEQYGQYYHFNSKQIIAIERNNGQDITDETWRKMFDEFEPKYVEICKELERYGYDCIETARSDENVDDILSDGYEFNSDGSIA